ncbi:MAG: hypothetical protein QOD67_1303, partial [Caballeronia sp.]|nr:hypothetical protein [Caballeronia sp.]
CANNDNIDFNHEGGTVQILSEPNQGFALTVALPLAAVETRERE